MKKFSMRVVLIISVLFIALGNANVSIAQERDTTNKLPEEELGSLDTSDVITEGVPQEKPAEAENLEEIPTTDELMQNPNVLERSVADSDDSDLTVVSSGAYWTLYYNSANGEYSLRMFGNVPSSRPTAWNNYLKRIKHIEIEEATLTGDFVGYFGWFIGLKGVRIEGSDLSGVTSFQQAFSNSSLEKVIIKNNYYSNSQSLTNTKQMFFMAKNLSELDLSGLNTSFVTTMERMFEGCENLKILNLSNFDFDTSSVINMDYMFADCTNLEELDVSKFDTSSVTFMQMMFQYCKSLEKLNLSSFDTSSVTRMNSMFEGCTSFEELDLSSFDTSSVGNMQTMFQGCTNLKVLYLDKFDDNITTNKNNMFGNTPLLSYLRFSHRFTKLENIGLENTNWYDEKNWVQFSNITQLQTYNKQQSEPTGYRKGAFFSLTMDAMGGEFEDAEEQKVQNKVSGEYWEEIVPVKEDYYFDGWYLDQNFTNKFDFSLPAAVSTTIYAKWVENYTVIIPASISLNEASELKVEGINRGGKTLSVGLNYGKTTISESNKLTLANTADTTVQCLAPLSWDGSETNPEKAILTLAPGSEITEGDAVMAIEAPENIQAGTYTGNLVFSINYE
ncbi:TPA: BspA family leucine-rich repeat surface protein [Listeria monocytogenes]|uniref:BspA family leucine-rich repeat surface protein n=1 Tax=Listeria monocytogenes TaxID=1639 RepID=UPI0010E9F59A|nr:BspA family leucine-rich repeat surface protein [Listeria monocytogenes]EAE2564404.1 BspA family leucine-rich repeat surface protein [Listeria monocytogenes]EAG1554911.1 BspA family leucine-rich repeat surface protein [Listeria monocytogenes]EAG9067980.1 BspA family leucine-rich repeat surface protein [Listeria monocytogenes]EAG9124528.1 BspA family leucine-rich repeat surface protein [Listeria monocytogenes]EHQ6233997.1 BspA family leucine-rich repeat surface protein [Listeria monocytogene